MQTNTTRNNVVNAAVPVMSNPDLLLRNLRLLDLDEEFDWPNLSEKTFSAGDGVKNLTRRLYCAGWIFYKMFELFEPQRTKRELGTLFPPFDSKQSSLLRSAVFKRLQVLKTSGFFGKEIVVRKTMFEDCKGPKFEELLAVFSSAVIIRVIQKDDNDRSIVKRAIGNANMHIDAASICLAYNVHLKAQLLERETLQRRWIKFTRILDRQKEALEQRAQTSTSNFSVDPKKRIPQRTLVRLNRCLSENWNGDEEWTDVLLHSDLHRPSGTLVEAAFSSVWKHVCADTLYALRPQANHSRLQTLEERLKEQRVRLSRWRATQSTFLSRKHAKSVTSETTLATERILAPPKYSLRSNTLKQSTDRLQSNLRQVDGPANLQRNGPRSGQHRRSKSAALERPQTEAVFTAPPASAGLRKPLANTGIRIATSPQNQVAPTRDLTIPSRNDETKMNLDATAVDTSMKAGHSLEPDGDSLEDISETFSNEDASAAEIVSSVLKEKLSPRRVPLTLAERTRISMATMGFKHGADQFVRIQEEPAVESDTRSPTAGLSDLAQRTRKSMSIRNPGSAIATRLTTRPRPSAVYPANPNESPRRATSLDESMFDETTIDLGEEDIFRSRPKVAVSPILSPMAQNDTASLVGLALKDDNYEDDFS